MHLHTHTHTHTQSSVVVAHAPAPTTHICVMEPRAADNFILTIIMMILCGSLLNVFAFACLIPAIFFSVMVSLTVLYGGGGGVTSPPTSGLWGAGGAACTPSSDYTVLLVDRDYLVVSVAVLYGGGGGGGGGAACALLRLHCFVSSILLLALPYVFQVFRHSGKRAEGRPGLEATCS